MAQRVGASAVASASQAFPLCRSFTPYGYHASQGGGDSPCDSPPREETEAAEENFAQRQLEALSEVAGAPMLAASAAAAGFRAGVGTESVACMGAANSVEERELPRSVSQPPRQLLPQPPLPQQPLPQLAPARQQLQRQRIDRPAPPRSRSRSRSRPGIGMPSGAVQAALVTGRLQGFCDGLAALGVEVLDDVTDVSDADLLVRSQTATAAR